MAQRSGASEQMEVPDVSNLVHLSRLKSLIGQLSGASQQN